MGAIASEITSLTSVYSTVYSDADHRKHQSSASLAFVRGSHRGPKNSPHKWPVTREMFPFDDVIMIPRMYIQMKRKACVWGSLIHALFTRTGWVWDRKCSVTQFTSPSYMIRWRNHCGEQTENSLTLSWFSAHSFWLHDDDLGRST